MCKSCGGPVDLVFRSSGRRAKYCASCASLTCACGAGKARETRMCIACRFGRRPPPPLSAEERERSCERCGEKFQNRRRLPESHGRFCSLKCCNAVTNKGRNAGISKVPLDRPSKRRPSHRVYFPRCPCGVVFTARKASARYCSADCMPSIARTSIATNATCRICGSAFEREHGGQCFCSDVCRAASARGTRSRSRKARRARGDDRGKHKKRAKRYGVAYEPINAQRVMERDGWKCRICGKAIKRDAVAPHPLSASLDHIIPMSKGGPHLYTNVQAAHFLCNSVKGTRSRGEQLLLVG